MLPRLPSAADLLLMLRRWAAFLLLLAAVAVALVYRSWLDAQAAAFVVLATTIDKPVVEWIASASTSSPGVSETTVGGQKATVVRPGSGSRWPAIVFVNGATERGRLHPEVQRLARGLARAGYLVVVPELPGLRRGEITLLTVAALVRIGRATADRSDARDARIGFVGVSVGATLALSAAADVELDGRVSAIAGIAPFSDLKEVARLATAGYVRTPTGLEPYDADDFVELAVARSLAASLPRGRDRTRLVAALSRIPNERDEPLANVALPSGAGPGVRALFRLLANDVPGEFDTLWAALPTPTRAVAERLSPILHATRLTMPIELATSPRDKYFPVTESRRLVRAAGNARLTVTDSLSHAIPEPSFAGVGAALSFNGFAVRGLRDLRG